MPIYRVCGFKSRLRHHENTTRAFPARVFSLQASMRPSLRRYCGRTLAFHFCGGPRCAGQAARCGRTVRGFHAVRQARRFGFGAGRGRPCVRIGARRKASAFQASKRAARRLTRVARTRCNEQLSACRHRLLSCRSISVRKNFQIALLPSSLVWHRIPTRSR